MPTIFAGGINITQHSPLPARGAHDANRTRDLVLTKDVLCQLSYVGTFND